MLSNSTYSKLNQCLIGVMIAVMAVIFTLMVVWMPIRLDDYVFINVYRELTDGSDEFSWQALVDALLNNRLYDNARLSNFCSPLSTIVRPFNEIFPYVAGLSCTIMVILSSLLTSVRRNRALALALTWIAIVVLLPWRNNIFTRDYILNYPVSAVFALSFICAMCYKSGIYLKRPLWFVGTLICAFLLGGWHEGFAVPVGVGMGVWALTRRLRMSWQWWTAFVMLTVSTIGFFWCPGMMLRTTNQMGNASSVELYKIVLQSFPAVLAILTICLGLCFKKLRTAILAQLRQPIMIVVVSALVVSFVLSAVIEYQPRMSFFPTLCAVIVFGRLLSSRVEAAGHKTSICIVIICLAACSAQGYASCLWQKRLYDQHAIVLPKILASPNGTAFYDVYVPDDIPKYTLYFPSRTLWRESWAFHAFDIAYGYSPAHMVVPVDLEYPTGKAVSADGSIHTTGRSLWSEDVDMATEGFVATSVLLRDGTRKPFVGTFVGRFISGEGDTLLYLMPNHINVADVDSIEFVQYSPRKEY